MRARLAAVNLLGVLLFLFVAPGVQAQTDGPVSAPPSYLVHYRAYRAAYEAGDLSTAVAEAQAALRAHVESRPPDGVRATLSVNVAAALLDAGLGEEAAQAVAEAAALPDQTARVDPALLALFQAHAALLVDPEAGLGLALEAAAAAPADDPILSVRALRLAQTAARLALGVDRFPEAAEGWRLVARLAERGDFPPDFLRGRALTGLGIALLMQGEERAALETLGQALRALAAFAGETETSEATLGQVAYAEALAWRSAVSALIDSHDWRRPDGSDAPEPAPLAGRAPRCPLMIDAQPLPEFPRGALDRFSVGAVVLRLSLDEGGAVTQIGALAFAPDDSFAEAVDAVAPLWRVERGPNAPAGCRMARWGELRELRFVFRDRD